ncbi:MAG: HAMP domain-containing histidine kinase [Chloroflexota bacterium]|nr:HAMP domain-containing histidine kinase [Chloroflexota bacterium]
MNTDSASAVSPNRQRYDGFGAYNAGDPSKKNGSLPRSDTSRRVWLLAAGLTALIIAWAVLGLTVERARLAVLNPRAQLGVEAAASFARLFGALVLFLFPTDKAGPRLRWLAAGFVVLGLGGLVFGYFLPLLDLYTELNTLIYASLFVRIIAGTLFVVGLLPRTPVPFARPAIVIALALVNAIGVAAVAGGEFLPSLIRGSNVTAVAARGDSLLPALTGWYFALSIIPLGLSIAAVVGAAREYRNKILGGWLVVAMVLLAGAQFHSFFWPTTYSPVLTTGDLLRLAFAAVVAVGAMLELRQIAAERAALLAAAEEQSRRLSELAVLKADFTAMVAHELGNPLAAVRACADVLATRQLGPEEQATALSVIQSETSVMTTLVADVQAAASVERFDFAVQPRAVPLGELMADAAAFARTLPGNHPFTMSGAPDVVVLADRDRIGQVLRNLLSNAAKYTSAGRPIELQATANGDCAHIAVVDHGNGIHPDDLARIFHKFGRGRDARGQKLPGVGLGLYLSRRIIRAHGGELEVHSTPGVGSVFGFNLEVVR